MSNGDAVDVRESVAEYYGRVLRSSADLKTSACCLVEAPNPAVSAVLAEVHPEVKDRFYGCGSPIPPLLDGISVLDLGCGSGRDCYVLSKLVGARGRVAGIDMTAEQLAVARKHQEYHARRFGFANVSFHHGYIEDLAAAGIADASVDLVVSNCVLNLSPDKRSVFGELLRVLRPGGELYFSDVFADRRVPAPLTRDPVLLGECLGGALYWNDFRALLAGAGVADVRVCARSRLELRNAEIQAQVGDIGFDSITVRAFKLELEAQQEDYGQAVRYRGTIPGAAHGFALDASLRFDTGRAVPVSGNVARMLAGSRYAPHFELFGDESRHFGPWNPGPVPAAVATATGGCC